MINLGTIDAMLNDLLQNGLKVNGGDKPGKTIIFAYSHKEAEQIVLEFNRLYLISDEIAKCIHTNIILFSC